MAKIDRIKEEIGFVKAVALAVIVVDGSLVSWLFSNLDKEASWRGWLCGIAFVITSTCLYFLYRMVYKLLADLEKAEK